MIRTAQVNLYTSLQQVCSALLFYLTTVHVYLKRKFPLFPTDTLSAGLVALFVLLTATGAIRDKRPSRTTAMNTSASHILIAEGIPCGQWSLPMSTLF